MAAISVVRKFTAEDAVAVKVAAERFCKRHNIQFNALEGANAAEVAIEWETSKDGWHAHLKSAWTRVYCRALSYPRQDSRLTVAFGHIGLACQ